MLKLNPKDWHPWGRWSQVMLFASPWFEVKNNKSRRKLKLPVTKGDIMDLDGYYYFWKDDLDKIYDFIINNIQNKTSWFLNFFSLCGKNIKKMLALEKKNSLEEFIAFLPEYLGFFTPLEIIDYYCLEKYLSEACLKFGIPMVVLTNKMQPKRKTLLMQYHCELKKLNLKNIDNFVKKYQWVGTHGFEGESLTKNKVLGELKTLARTQRKAHKKIMAKIPSALKPLISIGREMVFYRSQRIDAINKVAFSFRPKMQELGKKYGLSYFDIISFTHYELLDFIKSGNIPKNLKKRKKKFGITFIDGKYSILLGKKLKQALSQLQPKEKIKINEFKGTIAYTGKAVGEVKVLQSPKDISKVKAGDIIVANETTPDYILAMRKAGAFVTNQGGITSHAAIIARELKKPCIIGTKIATKVLKDGDLVEVDANKGVVRILKNSN